MSSKQVFYELEIIPGKADELLDIARQMVAMTPGTLKFTMSILMITY